MKSTPHPTRSVNKWRPETTSNDRRANEGAHVAQSCSASTVEQMTPLARWKRVGTTNVEISDLLTTIRPCYFDLELDENDEDKDETPFHWSINEVMKWLSSLQGLQVWTLQSFKWSSRACEYIKDDNATSRSYWRLAMYSLWNNRWVHQPPALLHMLLFENRPTCLTIDGEVQQGRTR